jgi:hypothetical protein
MSFITKLENAEKSTSAWFEKEWVKVYKAEPTVVEIADKTLPYLSLLLQTVIGAEAGQPAATTAGKILTKAQNDLDVAAALIYDTGATPTAASAITAVQTNLSGLLTASQITNKTSVATVTKAVSETGVLAAAITAASGSTAPVPA